MSNSSSLRSMLTLETSIAGSFGKKSISQILLKHSAKIRNRNKKRCIISHSSEKFPYGYDLNAYIDKAFEQMKADFPWATRDMIPEQTYYGIEKVGDDYQEI